MRPLASAATATAKFPKTSSVTWSEQARGTSSSSLLHLLPQPRFLSRLALAADHRNRAGLRAVFTHLFGIAHRDAGFEMLEAIAQHAVAMKIDLAPVRGFEESVTLLDEHPGDLRLRVLMGLHRMA